MRRLLLVVLLSALLSVWGSMALADGGSRAVVHIVRPGETLASIAQIYYGDPRRESVLVAENGLNAQGGAAIVVGLRLVVPWVHYHRVQEGETWTELATKFYGNARRAHVLIDTNNGVAGEQPDAGAELLIPYPLRHVAAQGENIQKVAKTYYGAGNQHAQRLRSFNNLRTFRLTRGQIVLVPLEDLLLSESGRALVEAQTGEAPGAGEVRDLQARIDAQLPSLREHVVEGRYEEALALGNRLLGTGQLTGNQVVTIQRELGTAFVALGREDLAIGAFGAALQRQPDLALDRLTTSPTVLRAFQRAQELASSAAPAPPEADAGDGRDAGE